MSLVALGPYESKSVYAGAEFFDTTGTPPGFCPECEHAPCIGGSKRFCTMRPRFLAADAVRREVLELLDKRYADPLYRVMRCAVSALAYPARSGGRDDQWLLDHISAETLDELAYIRTLLRELNS